LGVTSTVHGGGKRRSATDKAKGFCGYREKIRRLVTPVTWRLADSGLVRSVACKGMESVRSLELADIALGAATIIVMLALLLVSMPGWH